MRMKGISPIIAVIMLIAFTMVVAGILASWATQYVKVKLRECTNAGLWIERATYQSGNNKLLLVITNTGTIDLHGFTAILTYENGTVIKIPSNKTIAGKETETITFANVNGDGLEIVDIVSKECSVRDTIQREYIQGLGG
ncbi:MAG: hypothetical protein DRP03_01950 [Candidatus Aenigmatarchaeota archaeon]|nr:MAG: hypothetical protein DRP03_01950 [Candidatus Aenigmarchaeota archaeon]